MRRTGSATATIDAAVASARAGRPAVVGIVGLSGYGKSTLLRATARRLEGFHLLRAYGEPGAQDDRFELLNQWCGQPQPRHTMQGIGLLHEAVDSRQLTGPVALIVDDLQWVDPETGGGPGRPV